MLIWKLVEGKNQREDEGSLSDQGINLHTICQFKKEGKMKEPYYDFIKKASPYLTPL